MELLINMYYWFEPYLFRYIVSGLIILGLVLVSSLFLDVEHYIASLYGGNESDSRN